MNLYEISSQFAEKLSQIGQIIENGDTPTDEQTNELLCLHQDTANKLVNCGKYIKNLQAGIDGLDNEIKRLNAKKSSLTRQKDYLKANMLTAMTSCHIDKVDDLVMPIRVQNSPAAVQVDIDASGLPKEYQKISITADKTALGKALKAGIAIKGVQLVQSKSLRIG